MWRKYEEFKERTMNVTSVRRIWRIYKKNVRKERKMWGMDKKMWGIDKIMWRWYEECEECIKKNVRMV